MTKKITSAGLEDSFFLFKDTDGTNGTNGPDSADSAISKSIDQSISEDSCDDGRLPDITSEVMYYWRFVGANPWLKKDVKKCYSLSVQDKAVGAEFVISNSMGKMPFGIIPRQITRWLATELIKRNLNGISFDRGVPISLRRISLPKSPSELYRAITLSNTKPTTKQLRNLKEQIKRISYTTLVYRVSQKTKNKERFDLNNIGIISSIKHYFFTEDPVDDLFGKAGELTVTDEFFRATVLNKHLYPIAENTISLPFLTSIDWDIYVFLCLKLGQYALPIKNTKPLKITWPTLFAVIFPNKDVNISSEDSRKERYRIKGYFNRFIQKFKDNAHLPQNFEHYFTSDGLFIQGDTVVKIKSSRTFPNLQSPILTK